MQGLMSQWCWNLLSCFHCFSNPSPLQESPVLLCLASLFPILFLCGCWAKIRKILGCGEKRGTPVSLSAHEQVM
jgi:hypothetical protein